jgi:putative endopeptidase
MTWLEILAGLQSSARIMSYPRSANRVDRTEWLMTPQTVNAYYNPGMNEIVFPAAILQPPFFDVNADDDAANYGGIGASYWLMRSAMALMIKALNMMAMATFKIGGPIQIAPSFEKRADQLIKQYDQLSPSAAPDVKVNGALTIGENIGDLGGLTIAYKAYEISLDGKEAPIIDGYSGAQRFFMGWAQSWRGKYRPEEVRRRIATDPHSPDEFRCNQVVS